MHLCCCEQGAACALMPAPIILTEGALDIARTGTAVPPTGRSGTLPGTVRDMSIDRETRPSNIGSSNTGAERCQAVKDQGGQSQCR